MSFNAKLTFNNKEYDVLDCKYSFKRDVDSKGRPSSSIYGGIIEVHVESTESTDLLDAMINQYSLTSGEITFKRSDEESKMKTLSWESGYVVNFEESIDVVGSKPMSLKFKVSAKTIKVNNSSIQQEWPNK